MNAPESLPDGGREVAIAPALADHAINFLSSPGHLRATAHLYGLSSVPLDQARVLVLGCRAGANVFPFAAAYPQARVVGIDPDAGQIELARQHAEGLGLGNAEFFAADYAAVTPELGEFDYIVAHDVYSLLDRSQAVEILRICRLNLSFEGIAYVNYDTYPGARVDEAVRDAMLLYGHGADTAEEQTAAARTALTLFSNGMASGNPMAGAFVAAAEIGKADLDAGLFGFSRQAYYFVEFSELVSGYALICAGDAEPQIEMADTYGGNVSLAHGLLGLGKPRVLRQQNLDFSVGRRHRRTLIVHQERAEQASPQIDVARLMELRWAGRFRRCALGLRDVKNIYFETSPGQVFCTDDPVVQRVLDALGCAWPESLDAAGLADFVAAGPSVGEGKTAFEATQAALLYLVRRGLVRYSVDRTPYDTIGADALAVVAQALPALSDRERGGQAPLFNWWHEPVTEIIDRHVLELLAQGQSLAALDAYVEKEKAESKSSGPLGEKPATAPQGVSLTQQLRMLRRSALVLAGPTRWRDFLADGLEASKGERHSWMLYVQALSRCLLQQVPPKGLRGVTPAQHREAVELRNLAYKGKVSAETEAQVRRLIKQAPRNDAAWDALSCIVRDKGENTESLMALLHALRLDPTPAHRYALLALTLLARDSLDDAEQSALLALTIYPKYASAHNVLGSCYHKASRFYDAIYHYGRALEEDPSVVDSHGNLGVVLADIGDFDGAEKKYKEVLRLVPDNPQVWGSRFFGLNYFPDRTAEQIFEVYKEFDEIFGKPMRKHWLPHRNDKDSGRRLRIGYVSPDIRFHPVTLFLEPLMAHHNPDEFEVHIYAHLDVEDKVTEAFKGYAQHWTRTNGMTDDALARRIRADKIDILVDLAGHTGNNRLGVFARKPAPIQLTWLGFGCTTGLTAIDYILSDAEMAPPGSDHLFAEKPWRLSGSNFAYRPKSGMGDAGPLPALANGHVRFITLSRAIRFNDHLIRTWAEIMRRVPSSKLVVDSRSYVSPGLREELESRFAVHGVQASRLEIGFHSPPWDLLRSADITLDCFPHNSGTTLFESLYQGLPFITLAGRPGVGRIGASTLIGLGRGDWIASTEAEYIDKVVALASDIPALERIRAGLRAEMQASSLMDEPAFARKVETAFRAMFKQWCEKQA